MHFFIILISIVIATVLFVFLCIDIKTTVKSISTRANGFFSNPRCPLCNKELQDYGCAVGGLTPEPLYICVNEKCERCEL